MAHESFIMITMFEAKMNIKVYRMHQWEKFCNAITK